MRRRIFATLVFAVLLGAGAATAQTGGTDLVTAVRDGGGKLRLISWDTTGIRLNGEGTSAGAVSLISAARLPGGSARPERMATAVRDSRGELLVLSWKVAADGVITPNRQAPGAFNKAGAVSRIAAIGNRTGDRVITAVRDGSGRLRVIPWLVSASGSVNRLRGEVAGGAVSDRLGVAPLDNVISATFVDANHTLVATAVRDGGGNLKINTWRLAPDGKLSPLREAAAGAITEVSAVAVGGRLVTAVRDGGGNLKLIAWAVNAGDGSLARRDEAQAGAARLITAFPLTRNRMVTAVRDGGGNLMVIAWEVPPAPAEIVRVDDASAGAVSRIAGSVCGELLPVGTVEFQTSVRDGGGELKTLRWRLPEGGNTITRVTSRESGAGAASLVSTACFHP